MIKNILYILAILVSVAGAYFAYSNTEKLKDQQQKTSTVEGQKKIVLGNVAKTEKELKEIQEEVKETEQAIADTSAAIDSTKSKEASLKKTLARHEADLITIEEEIDALVILKEEILEALAGVGVSKADEIPAKIDELSDGVKEKEDTLSALENTLTSLKGQIENKKAQRSETNSRLTEIKENIKGNAMTATVTSVNTEWGFVVINRGADNSPITPDSKLLVQRSGRYVGSLDVATLNPTQTICDLDLSGFKGGSLVRPGDTVILKDSLGR